MTDEQGVALMVLLLISFGVMIVGELVRSYRSKQKMLKDFDSAIIYADHLELRSGADVRLVARKDGKFVVALDLDDVLGVCKYSKTEVHLVFQDATRVLVQYAASCDADLLYRSIMTALEERTKEEMTDTPDQDFTEHTQVTLVPMEGHEVDVQENGQPGLKIDLSGVTALYVVDCDLYATMHGKCVIKGFSSRVNAEKALRLLEAAIANTHSSCCSQIQEQADPVCSYRVLVRMSHDRLEFLQDGYCLVRIHPERVAHLDAVDTRIHVVCHDNEEVWISFVDEAAASVAAHKAVEVLAAYEALTKKPAFIQKPYSGLQLPNRLVDTMEGRDFDLVLVLDTVRDICVGDVLTIHGANMVEGPTMKLRKIIKCLHQDSDAVRDVKHITVVFISEMYNCIFVTFNRSDDAAKSDVVVQPTAAPRDVLGPFVLTDIDGNARAADYLGPWVTLELTCEVSPTDLQYFDRVAIKDEGGLLTIQNLDRQWVGTCRLVNVCLSRPGWWSDYLAATAAYPEHAAMVVSVEYPKFSVKLPYPGGDLGHISVSGEADDMRSKELDPALADTPEAPDDVRVISVDELAQAYHGPSILLKLAPGDGEAYRGDKIILRNVEGQLVAFANTARYWDQSRQVLDMDYTGRTNQELLAISDYITASECIYGNEALVTNVMGDVIVVKLPHNGNDLRHAWKAMQALKRIGDTGSTYLRTDCPAKYREYLESSLDIGYREYLINKDLIAQETSEVVLDPDPDDVFALRRGQYVGPEVRVTLAHPADVRVGDRLVFVCGTGQVVVNNLDRRWSERCPCMLTDGVPDDNSVLKAQADYLSATASRDDHAALVAAVDGNVVTVVLPFDGDDRRRLQVQAGKDPYDCDCLCWPVDRLTAYWISPTYSKRYDDEYSVALAVGHVERELRLYDRIQINIALHHILVGTTLYPYRLPFEERLNYYKCIAGRLINKSNLKFEVVAIRPDRVTLRPIGPPYTDCGPDHSGPHVQLPLI